MVSFFLTVARVLFVCLLSSTVLAGGGDDDGHGNNGNGNNGQCKNPKIRREWRKFSNDEQADFIRAVKCLAKLPHDPSLTPTTPVDISQIPPIDPSSSLYDDLVYMHMDLNVRVHFTGMFLPWHRYYVQYFEDVLVEKCQYKGTAPYWDWTLDAPDFYNAKFWGDSDHGMGRWGDPNNDYEISTGGLKDMVVNYPVPHHIRRNYTVYPFRNPGVAPFPINPNGPPPDPNFMINSTMTKTNVDSLVNGYPGDHRGFQTYMESLPGVHLGIHIILGGELSGTCPKGLVPPACIPGAKWSPNDPLFFFHHGMIDKIWSDWQKKDVRNKYSYGGGETEAFNSYANFSVFPTGYPPEINFNTDIPGDGLWSGVKLWDIMDTQAGKLCYKYE